MKPWILSAALVVLAAGLVACGDYEGTEGGSRAGVTTQEKMQSKIDEWQNDLAQLGDRIDEWSDQMKAKADSMSDEARRNWEQTKQSLEKQRAELSRKIEDAKNAGADAWNDVSANIQSAWEDLKANFEQAKNDIGS